MVVSATSPVRGSVVVIAPGTTFSRGTLISLILPAAIASSADSPALICSVAPRTWTTSRSSSAFASTPRTYKNTKVAPSAAMTTATMRRMALRGMTSFSQFVWGRVLVEKADDLGAELGTEVVDRRADVRCGQCLVCDEHDADGTDGLLRDRDAVVGADLRVALARGGGLVGDERAAEVDDRVVLGASGGRLDLEHRDPVEARRLVDVLGELGAGVRRR